MKFGDFLSNHITEIALITIVLFALFSMPVAFLGKRTEYNYKVTFDSTQVVNVKLINDTTHEDK